MNKRFLIYGVIAALLYLVLATDSPKDPYGAEFSLRDVESLKSLCLEEVIGFDSGMPGKLVYCDCVVPDFTARLLKPEKFQEAFSKTLKTHLTSLKQTRRKARNVASVGAAPSKFETSNKPFNVLIARFKLKYPLDSLDENYKELTATTAKAWKRSMYNCSKLDIELK